MTLKWGLSAILLLGIGLTGRGFSVCKTQSRLLLRWSATATSRQLSTVTRTKLPSHSDILSVDVNANDDEDDGEDEGEGEGEDEGVAETQVEEGSLRLKVRQHVNPLASKYRVPIALEEDWVEKTFPNPTHPILIDVGCARGTWALKYGKSNLNHNILGLEIRRPVVELALRRKKVWGLTNVHFFAANANVDLERILKDLVVTRKSDIKMISVHHPDPHFKNKHKKRRVVNDEFVAQLATLLPKGVRLFVQSDVKELAQDMVSTITSNSGFVPEDGQSLVDIQNNSAPTDIMTEREVATLNKGLPVYRCLFKRN